MAVVLVTGAAGFIGAHLASALLARGDEVIGLDNLNPYYDPGLKQARLDRLIGPAARFTFHRTDLADHAAVARLFQSRPDITHIAHLGAQAGVRWSLEAPFAYTAANVTGHLAVLEAARRHAPALRHMVYASTSSVYGKRLDGPFRETDRVDRPASLYAATKLADEAMSQAYADLYGIPLTGLRFFTVYGPWGRPDMAYWLFTDAILKGQPVRLFNEGQMLRDFTYVEDIVSGIITALDHPAAGGGHRLYNIGNSQPEKVLDFLAILEDLLGVRAIRELLPNQPGDVPNTFADTTAMRRDFGWEPTTGLRSGLGQFVNWWRGYFT